MTMRANGNLAPRPEVRRQGDKRIRMAGNRPPTAFFAAVSQSWARTDLNACLDQALSDVADEMGRELRVQKEYGVSLPVLCRPLELGRVFGYLLIQAAQGVGIRGLIRVATRRQGDHVQIQLAASGAGSPVEDRKKIFDPFIRSGENGGGVGLWKNSGYEIIKQHGGDIWVASEVGKGTTFIISLPIDGERGADV